MRKETMKTYMTPGMVVTRVQYVTPLLGSSSDPVSTDGGLTVPKPSDSFGGDESVAAPVWGCRWDADDVG